MEYSEDQITALRICLRLIKEGKREVKLAGAAGTGKSTLMRKIIMECGRSTVLLAPTGKAAVRLKQTTGKSTSTIHSALYPGAIEDEEGNLRWEDPGPVCKPGQLVIVDESSMIGIRLYEDLMDNIPPGATVLFVGDPFQLPPVNELPGVNLAAADAQLLRVHRQAQDNPVLQLATATRDGGWSPWLMKYDNANPLLQKAYGAQGMLDQATNLFKVDSDAIILCYTNARRNAFNADIRNQLGFTKAIEAGDRMIVRMNNKRSGVMNGEIFKVEKVKNYTSAKYGKYAIVTFEGRKTPFKIKLRFLGKSRNDYWNWAKAQHKLPKNFIHADHAYAITIHSSQGSEYEHVFYFWEEAQTRLFYQDAPTCQAMAYTGFTRSFKHLYVYR